jgi:hypothetical protein
MGPLTQTRRPPKTTPPVPRVNWIVSLAGKRLRSNADDWPGEKPVGLRRTYNTCRFVTLVMNQKTKVLGRAKPGKVGA